MGLKNSSTIPSTATDSPGFTRKLPIFGWRTYATFRDDLRNELNAWIRSAKEIDGCIDFDLALRGSENPSAFREGFDSGDHLHPSSKAYQAMAECAYEVLRK